MHALCLSEVFVGVIGIERVDGDLKFLPIAGGVKHPGVSAVHFGQFKLVHQGQDQVIGGLDVFETEVPVDGMIEFGLVNSPRNACDLAGSDEAAIADDPGEKGPLGRPTSITPDLPVLEVVYKSAEPIDRGEHFE